MERDLPARLSDSQRAVLSEFYAGRISAGQITQRLGIAVPEAAQNLSPERPLRGSPKMARQRAVSIPNLLRWAGH
jgi:hypothetical protein